MKLNDKIRFKKGQTDKPATFIRRIGELNGEEVVAIRIDGAEWIVRRTEIEDAKDQATREKQEVEAVVSALIPLHKKVFKTTIAEAMGISVYVLNSRIDGIKEHFPQFELMPKAA